MGSQTVTPQKHKHPDPMTNTGLWDFFYHQEGPLQPHSLISDVTEPKELQTIISSDTQSSCWSYSMYFIQLTSIDCATEYDGKPSHPQKSYSSG